MVHYGTIIENSGPLLHMMVMRFEAKHSFSKHLAHIICNFKNIAFSLASRHQLSHAFVWMTRCPLKGISVVGNGTIISSSDIRHKSLILPLIGEKIDVFMTEKVVIFGQKYKTKMSVLHSISDEGEPSFVKIEQIYVHRNVIYFIGLKWHVHMYSHLTLSYYCSLDSERICLRASDLADYKPFDAVHCLKPTCIYEHIILRHYLYHCNVLKLFFFF